MTVLPFEILDLVFSFLDIDPSTWSTLKAISETTPNPLFRGVVDRRLYAHVIVTNIESNRPPGQFYHSDLLQHLSSNPQVANFIRTFHIQIQIPGPERRYDETTSILRMLPSSLKGISLSSSKEHTIITWSLLHGPFRKAFLDCLWSPNITDVSMRWIESFPLSIFDRCAKLQRISLQQVNCTSCTSAQFPPQITSLDIDRTPCLPEILSWAEKGHKLRSLGLGSGRNNQYPLLAKLFHSYSDSLIELELDFGVASFASIYYHEDSLPLSLLPNLKQLTIWDAIGSRELLIQHKFLVNFPFPYVANFVATSQSLKRLILYINMAPWHINDIAKSVVWRPLVLLAERPSLEHIELRVVPSVSKDRRDMEARIDMISVLMGVPELKQLCEEGFLSMERSRRLGYSSTEHFLDLL